MPEKVRLDLAAALSLTLEWAVRVRMLLTMKDAM